MGLTGWIDLIDIIDIKTGIDYGKGCEIDEKLLLG